MSKPGGGVQLGAEAVPVFRHAPPAKTRKLSVVLPLSGLRMYAFRFETRNPLAFHVGVRLRAHASTVTPPSGLGATVPGTTISSFTPSKLGASEPAKAPGPPSVGP